MTNRLTSRPSPTGPNTGNSEGWDDIQEEINQAQPGDTITIDMNGETEVPAEMFEEVRARDVTVELDLGGGITWTVNGQDVPTDTSLSDLDLGVDLGTNGISADVINTVTGAYGTVQMTLAHDGAFWLYPYPHRPPGPGRTPGTGPTSTTTTRRRKR